MSMLKGTYVANLKDIPANAIRVYVNNANLLAPSKQLKILAGVMKDPLTGEKHTPKMPFDEYSQLYQQEVRASPIAMEKLRAIKKLAQTKDVYLVCYCKNSAQCHRSILMKMIEMEICES